MPRIYLSTDPSVRFKAKLRPQENGCILYHEKKSAYGIVSLGYGRSGIGAHRLAWELKYGLIPKGLCVLHKCDTPACCNVDHLFLGTKRDNILDATKKGRNAHGESHGCAKLTTKDVAQIRDLYKGRDRGPTQRELARRFKVCKTTIGWCVRGKTWRRVVRH